MSLGTETSSGLWSLQGQDAVRPRRYLFQAKRHEAAAEESVSHRISKQQGI